MNFKRSTIMHYHGDVLNKSLGSKNKGCYFISFHLFYFHISHVTYTFQNKVSMHEHYIFYFKVFFILTIKDELIRFGVGKVKGHRVINIEKCQKIFC